MTEPTVSVVIPVWNDRENLRRCLECLAASSFTDFEAIVVDDRSTDDPAQVLEAAGIQWIHLERRSGPAAARNRGAAAARGRYLFFVDADVCVHPETLARVVATFEGDATIDALFGSYDREPRERNVLSQYKNLFHHFVHQEGAEEASTFWCGCGAIKRSVFLEMGGLDTRYDRPSIEDIELGVRLRKAGHRIVLRKEIQVTHLKRWTLWGILKSDVRDRALPWTRLILQEGRLPDDLNLRLSQRVSAFLAGLFFLALGIASARRPLLIAAPLLILLAVLVFDHGSSQGRSWSLKLLAVVLAAMGTTAMATTLPPVPWGLLAAGALTALVLLNARFYAFFARERGPLFALFVVPLHVLYYLYSGAAFVLGTVRHVWGSTKRRAREGAEAKADASPP